MARLNFLTGARYRFSMNSIGLAVLMIVAVSVTGCAQPRSPLEMKRGEVVKEYPHDATAFTQGLVSTMTVFFLKGPVKKDARFYAK